MSALVGLRLRAAFGFEVDLAGVGGVLVAMAAEGMSWDELLVVRARLGLGFAGAGSVTSSSSFASASASASASSLLVLIVALGVCVGALRLVPAAGPLVKF